MGINPKIKQMKVKVFYKVGITFMMLFIMILSIRCQRADTNDKVTNAAELLSREEEDWKKVEATVLSFCNYPGECEKFYNSTFLEKRIFEDSVHKYNLDVIKKFLRQYPQGNHYFQALKYYFSYIVEPRFIDSITIRNKKAVLDTEIEYIHVKSRQSQNYQKMRLLPYDNELRKKWLQEGDSLVQEFLKSEAPTDQKASVEVYNLARDKRMAKYLYQYLDPNKKEEESEYWTLFDEYFWKDFIDRMDRLIFKYPNYSRWPTNVDLFIQGITLDFLSPKMKEALWEHFRDITDRPELFDKHPVIAQVHKKAKENLRAMEAYKVFDKNEPLQMQFTSVDGKKIDLQDYRGKVVLLDFWSIRCAPCIKEMPHIRALHDKYKAEGFEVIGISAESDKDKERVLEVIQKQGANWPQLLDKGTNVVVSHLSLFNITSFPTVWLLNKEGIIVDKNARGDRLEPLIRKHLELE